MGIKYFSVPVEGNNSYSVEKLDEFANVLEENNGKILIHCASCYRVTYLIMAYLIKYQHYPIDEAVHFGKKLKFTSPLEDLLGKELTMNYK